VNHPEVPRWDIATAASSIARKAMTLIIRGFRDLKLPVGEMHRSR